MKLGFCERSETKTIVELIPVSEVIREGRRRSANDWSYTLDANDLALVADRGFTGHEYLSYFNLYNMNGRMYDPLVGRFISPDPYVQAPNMTQSMNRYTYCMNNPLVYVDYNGYTWFTKLGAWLGSTGRTLVTIGVTIGVGLAAGALIVASGGTLTPLILAGIGGLSGMTGGILGTAFSGGSGKDYWHAGINGFVSGAISTYIGGAVGKWAVKGLKDFGITGLTRYANSPVIKSALVSSVSSSLGGGAGGFVSEYLLSGGNFESAVQAGKDGLIFGAALGLATGARAGYKQAKAMEIDPWTGKSVKSSYSSQSNLKYSDKQMGHKFAEHIDQNLEGYRSIEEYRRLANDIYNDPTSIKITYPIDAPMYPGETHFYNGNNILRIDPKGNFRSLYPNK